MKTFSLLGINFYYWNYWKNWNVEHEIEIFLFVLNFYPFSVYVSIFNFEFEIMFCKKENL